MTKYRCHVHGATMARNHALGTNDPIVCLRPDDDPGLAIIVREARWDEGPTKFVHKPGEPLPNTGGKAVAWIETSGPVYVKLDNNRDFVLLNDELAREIGVRGF